jgi:cell shape-determining protein MreC
MWGPSKSDQPSVVVFNLQQRRAVFFDWIWYGVIILVLWLVEFVGVGRTLRGWTELLLVPTLAVVSQGVQFVETPLHMVTNSFRATRRIQDLELKYSAALADLGALNALEKENEALRGLLENTDRKLVNNVITRPIVSFAHPTVAVGSAEGVSNGALILIGKTVVGRVSEVSEHTATIDLLYRTDSNPIVAVTDSGVEGVLVGDGQRLLLTEVARDAQVTIGQRVVTVGQPGVPPDLFLGQVVAEESDPADPVKQVVIEQVVDFYQARIVEVVQ